jgi:hypothetical protein
MWLVRWSSLEKGGLFKREIGLLLERNGLIIGGGGLLERGLNRGWTKVNATFSELVDTCG